MSPIIEGLLLGLSVAAPVGPTNIELIRRGLRGGFWACIAFAAGAIAALLLYLLAVLGGLSVLTEFEWFNTLLSVFGVVVLFYLGYSSLHDFFQPPDLALESPGYGGPGSAKDGRQHFLPGILLTITNPAVLVFWSGIIGADLSARRVDLGDSSLVCGGILVGVTVWLLFLSTLIHLGRRHITSRVFRYVAALAGLVLIGFGLRFGYRIFQEFVSP